jgi:uncharacterized protein YndB with AHSA1/START domain
VSDRRDVDVVVQCTASVEAVWTLLDDARGWSRWAPFRTSVLEREGSPVPDEVGAPRSFGTGPVLSREEVVVFDPPRRLVHELRSGLPPRDHRAEVTLTPAGSGTGSPGEPASRRGSPARDGSSACPPAGDRRHGHAPGAARGGTGGRGADRVRAGRIAASRGTPSRCRGWMPVGRAVATVNDSPTSYRSTRQVARRGVFITDRSDAPVGIALGYGQERAAAPGGWQAVGPPRPAAGRS